MKRRSLAVLPILLLTLTLTGCSNMSLPTFESEQKKALVREQQIQELIPKTEIIKVREAEGTTNCSGGAVSYYSVKHVETADGFDMRAWLESTAKHYEEIGVLRVERSGSIAAGNLRQIYVMFSEDSYLRAAMRDEPLRDGSHLREITITSAASCSQPPTTPLP